MTSHVLNNRYHLKEKIGYGGMGQVYLGWDSLLERPVAIKLMPNYDPQIRERYRREAASLASLCHPNIIKIYDVGEDCGVIFIVMEYIQGPTLQEIIKAKAPLPLIEGLNIMRKVLDGLGEVHRKGIIHRDIKPQNILITKQGEVKLCDFGIAKILTNQSMTATGMALGTVQYMAPEQLMGGVIKPASDIYSIGVILYELFSGFLPFNGKNIGEIAQQHFNKFPPPLNNLNPRINRDLELIIMRCLAKNPEERFQRTEELKFWMEKITEGNLKATIFQGLSINPTRQLPFVKANALMLDKSNIFKHMNSKFYRKFQISCLNLPKYFLKRIPWLKIFALAILTLFLINGIHNFKPWIENKSKELVKQSLLSELQNSLPTLKKQQNPQQKNVKSQVNKVQKSLQTLQKDFQQGDQKVIEDNLDKWQKGLEDTKEEIQDRILTEGEILQKLKEKIQESLKKKYQKENQVDNYQGKKTKRKHID